MFNRFCVAAAAVLISTTQATAAASPDHGAMLTEKWCSSCHRVTTVEDDPIGDLVPSFQAIAHHRTTAQIVAKLRDPHGGMPTDAMTDKDIRDVAAFINSLGQ